MILVETVTSLYTDMCILFPLEITAASADKSGFTSAARLYTIFFLFYPQWPVSSARDVRTNRSFSLPALAITGHELFGKLLTKKITSFSHFVHVHQAVDD